VPFDFPWSLPIIFLAFFLSYSASMGCVTCTAHLLWTLYLSIKQINATGRDSALRFSEQSPKHESNAHMQFICCKQNKRYCRREEPHTVQVRSSHRRAPPACLHFLGFPAVPHSSSSSAGAMSHSPSAMHPSDVMGTGRQYTIFSSTAITA